MDPATYIQQQIAAVLGMAYPGAAPAEVVRLSTGLSNMWVNLIFPNLQVDLVTGKVTFIVPGADA